MVMDLHLPHWRLQLPGPHRGFWGSSAMTKPALRTLLDVQRIRCYHDIRSGSYVFTFIGVFPRDDSPKELRPADIRESAPKRLQALPRRPLTGPSKEGVGRRGIYPAITVSLVLLDPSAADDTGTLRRRLYFLAFRGFQAGLSI